MSKVMIEKLDHNSSKSDEMAFIKKVREAAGTGSYMASFLTEDMIKWLERMVDDDFSTDICSELDAYKMTNPHHEGEVAKLSEVNKSLVKQLTHFEGEIKSLKVDMEILPAVSAERDDLKKKYANLEYAFGEMKRMKDEEIEDSGAVIEALLAGGDREEAARHALRLGKTQQMKDDIERGD
jgi:hypothetical protein